MSTLCSNCENCSSSHDGTYGSGRFCSSACSRGFSTKGKRKEINEKVSRKMAGRPTGRVMSQKEKDHLRRGHLEYYASLSFDTLGPESRKKRILIEQDGRCKRCNNNEWLGHPLVLELEHKDGNNQNNSRDNLECLCPNCHSLTPTWRGRNKGNMKRITDDDFILALQNNTSVHSALVFLGLTPKGGNYVRAKRLIKENNISIKVPPGSSW